MIGARFLSWLSGAGQAPRSGGARDNEDAVREAVSRAIFARMWSERPHDFGPAFEHDKDLFDRAADDAIRALREAGG